MATQTNLIIQSNDDLSVEMRADTLEPKESLKRIAVYMDKLALGCSNGGASVDMQVTESGGVKATGTVTFSGVGAANDTFLVNGVTFTAKASGATGNEWNVGGTAAISATNLAAAVTASATALVNQHVTAAAASGVVTVTARKKAYMGNAVTIAEGVDASSHMTVSGARLTGGVDPTSKVMHSGI